MSKVWRFTGNPENWLTAIGIGKWALNEGNKGLWERGIHSGDTVLFHSTRKSDFTEGAVSSVIGFGYVGDGMTVKSENWWVQEVRDQKNYWPYVIPLSEIYLFSETEGIDFATPVDKKPPTQVNAEIDRLLENSMALRDLNERARAIDPNCPRFPVNGSASRLNKIFEQLILEQRDDFFIPRRGQTTDLLEERLTEPIDERLSRMDKTTLLAQAIAFDNRGSASHQLSQRPRRVRKENQVQKRRVAALENYTCQLCGFRCEYVRGNGKVGWIIEVDHIQDKAEKGMENLRNLWALCPNCHAKKTRGIIRVDLQLKKVFEGESEIKLLRDSHLFS